MIKTQTQLAMPPQIGILGGGQLAQMLCVAAHGMGIRPFVLATKTSDPSHTVTRDFFIDNGSDDEIQKFFSHVDVVTIENEFIDLVRFERILGDEFSRKLLPRVETLKLVQSKLDQKNFLKKNKIGTLDFTEIHSLDDLDLAFKKFKGRLVVKKARLGYDGRGTYIFKGPKDFRKFEDFKETLPLDLNLFGYAEALADFKKEIAIVITRSTRGEIKSFPVVETFQEGGICRWAVSPAHISKKSVKEAESLAVKIMSRLKAVGTFGIEMFVMRDQGVVINEIAPRVHNSGHLTMNGSLTNQFEQHLRSVLGWPLHDAKLEVPTAMVNIIGSTENSIYGASQIPIQSIEKNSWIHWYGKSGAVFGRKLGHVNSIGKTTGEALKLAKRQRQKILI